jgi:hypothetical protein
VALRIRDVEHVKQVAVQQVVRRASDGMPVASKQDRRGQAPHS